MKDYRQQLHNLGQFLGGSFHNAWPELNPQIEGKERYEVVLDNAIQIWSNESLNCIVLELKELIGLCLPEPDLKIIVSEHLHANYYPPGTGMTYQEWLKAVHKYLSEAIDRIDS